MKDYALYKCFYCGMCKSIREKHKSNLLRLSVNYDMTFINILFHGITKQEMAFKEEACVLNPFKKKSVLKTDPVSETCVYLNTLLADFKTRDDLLDSPSFSKRFLRFFFKRKIKQAQKELPEVAKLLEIAYTKQVEVEKNDRATFDQASIPFAECMQGIFQAILGENYSESVGELAFFLAKYVYLLDAVDDFEKDVKKGEFNPFKRYGDAKNKVELINKHGDELKEILNGLLFCVKDAYSHIPVFNTESIITNTLWYGLGARAREIFDKEKRKCIKTHTKF